MKNAWGLRFIFASNSRQILMCFVDLFPFPFPWSFIKEQYSLVLIIKSLLFLRGLFGKIIPPGRDLSEHSHLFSFKTFNLNNDAWLHHLDTQDNQLRVVHIQL